MKPSTILAARSHLPASALQLAERMGVTPARAYQVISALVAGSYAEPWGDTLTTSGRLVAVYRATEKALV